LPEFIKAAGQPPDMIISYDREIGLASNLGVAAVRKCSSLQRSLAPVYRQLTGETQQASHSLLKRLFK